MLVTSGHRQITGRGRSARSSPADAAALILAVVATPLSGPGVKETALHYERYSRLVAKDEGGEPANWRLKRLRELVPGRTLGEALTAVIEAIVDEPRQACDLFEQALPNSAGTWTEFSIAIELEAPMPTASIRISAQQRKETTLEHPGRPPISIADVVAEFSAHVHYGPTYESARDYLETLPELAPGARRGSDLTQIRRFTHNTLKPVADLFSVRDK
ncbi:hypothetical protein QA640_43820 (plasmid) [Bradyrhizobium sp. CB82]|uniref:hypothetical protein n=1 Tax=Bradyrhizobium sp. CB82 TaxID=3039159 RepID=UPI0024B0CF87|nr:hypothetical protein [Bradyrhizobium sp. CB82]WFU45779.1 hypothetical protein QA640_43820 [Bradyrhizobium sp. CB82]